MIPKFLSPEVVPFVEILLVGLPAVPVRKLVCVWCEVVITPGALPVSHGMCTPCFAQAVA